MTSDITPHIPDVTIGNGEDVSAFYTRLLALESALNAAIAAINAEHPGSIEPYVVPVTPPASGGGSLTPSDFNSWNVGPGSNIIQTDGIDTLTAAGGSFAHVDIGLSDNLAIEFDGQITATLIDFCFLRDQSGTGQYFRFSSSNTYPSGFGDVTTTGFTSWEPSLATRTHTNPVKTFDTNKWYRIRLEYSDGTASVYVDGELYTSADLPTANDRTYIAITNEGTIRNLSYGSLSGSVAPSDELAPGALMFDFESSKLDTTGLLSSGEITLDSNQSVGEYQGHSALIDAGNGVLQFTPSTPITVATATQALEIEGRLFIPNITTRHIFLTVYLEGAGPGYVTFETSGYQNSKIASYSSASSGYNAVSATDWPTGEWAKFKMVYTKPDAGRKIQLYLNDVLVAESGGGVAEADLKLAELTIGNWREGSYSPDIQAIRDLVIRAID